MLIVQKKWSLGVGANTHYSYALCKELRRTEKRVYVEFSAGDSFALDGGHKEKYAPLEAVLTENGSLALLGALVEAANDLGKRQRAIDEQRDAHQVAALEFHAEVMNGILA